VAEVMVATMCLEKMAAKAAKKTQAVVVALALQDKQIRQSAAEAVQAYVFFVILLT